MANLKFLSRLGLVGALFGATLLINPAYLTGCGASGINSPSYDFGEAELSALVEGAYTGVVTLDDGGKGQLTLTIKQSATAYEPFASIWDVLPINSALACGDRSLIKGAQACINTTTMPIEGDITINRLDEQGQPTQDAIISAQPVRGQAFVAGTKLSNVELTAFWSKDDRVVLRSEDGQSFSAQGQWIKPSGVASPVSQLSKQ